VKVRREFVVLATLLGLVAIVDFSRRVYVGRDDALRQFEAPAMQQVPPPETAAALSARLVHWLPETAGGGVGIAAKAELRLSGVMTGRDGTIALLATVPSEGRPAEIFRAAEGDLVEGWKVVSIAPRSVTLQGDAGERQLLLFEPRQPVKAATGGKQDKREKRKKNDKRATGDGSGTSK